MSRQEQADMLQMHRSFALLLIDRNTIRIVTSGDILIASIRHRHLQIVQCGHVPSLTLRKRGLRLLGRAIHAIAQKGLAEDFQHIFPGLEAVQAILGIGRCVVDVRVGILALRPKYRVSILDAGAGGQHCRRGGGRSGGDGRGHQDRRRERSDVDGEAFRWCWCVRKSFHMILVPIGEGCGAGLGQV
jgi:hypothetical protein